jgi:integrase
MAIVRRPSHPFRLREYRIHEVRSACIEDPSIQRKQEKALAASAANNTFGSIAGEYLETLEANGAAPAIIEKNRWLLNSLAAPLAKRPMTGITPAEVLDLLKKVEKTGRRESARRLQATIGAVFRLAITTLRATNDPTFPLKGALLRPQVKNHAAITDEKKVGGLMRSIDEYDGCPTINAALQMLALTMARPGELRGMRRTEVDFKKAVWSIPAERMTMRVPHDVPLSQQALKVLRDVWPLSEGAELVFPSIRSNKKSLSENALNSALRRMGYTKEEMTGHGFRTTASTILNSRGFSGDVIEVALAHLDRNKVQRTYNRATYWPERVQLLNAWADLLDEFRRAA